MSLWNDFLNKIAKPTGRAVVRGAENVGGFVGTALTSPAQAVLNSIIPAGTNIGLGNTAMSQLSNKAQKEIKENLQYEAFKTARSNDILLKLSTALEEKVISPAITRPIGTVGLLTDPTSPLYQPGEFESGFQLTDIKRAYKRTEKVSAYQALTKSALMRLDPLHDKLQDLVFNIGEIAEDEVNLWDDQNIQKNYVDNAVGRWYTGFGDFFTGNAGIYGATKLVTTLGKIPMKRMGFNTRAKSLNDFEKELDEGLIFAETGGLKGKQSVAADEIYQMANTTDPNMIQRFVTKYSNNDALPGLIQEATDPTLIRDYILADKAYLPALERLSRGNKAKLAELGNLPGVIRAKSLLDDELYQPDGEALVRIKGAFDDVIDKDPDYKRIRDTFFDSEGNLTSFGKEGYFPIEPVVGKNIFSKTRQRANVLNAAAMTRDFSKVGGISERIIGGARPNSLTIRLIRFTGTYKPLGWVTYSGARAGDGLVELDSFFDDLILFRDGRNKIEVAPGQYVTAAEYRNRVKSEWIAAKTDLERDNLLDRLEDRIGQDIARTLGIYNEKVREFTQDVKNRLAKNQVNIGKNGFAVDYNGNGIIVDPQTLPQLVDSRRLVPWNIIEKELIRASKSKSWQRGAITTEDIWNNINETFNKYWSFDVLARPSYIMKQSISEPVLSAGLSQGFAEVMQDVPGFTKRFLMNNKNRIMEKASLVVNAKELKAVNNTVENLSDQLSAATQQLDNLVSEADLFFERDRLSPVTRRENQEIVREALRKANKLVDAIELELRDAVRPYGDMGQVPTIANLERRLAFLDKKTTPEFKARHASDIANAKAAITKAKGEINTLMPNQKALNEIYDKMETIYNKIDNIMLKELSEAQYKQALVHGKSAEYKKRYYGEPVRYRMVGNQWMPIESLFDTNKLGTALRAEFENGQTVAATFLSEVNVGVRNGTLMRRGPSVVTRVTDRLYFEELAYLSNRALRNDPLVKMVLEEAPDADILRWAATEGRPYVDQFGTITDGMLPDFVKDRIGFVKRYLPSAEARALVAKKEVTSQELKEVLTKYPDVFARLSPIHPNDFDYHLASEVLGKRALASFEDAVNRGMAKVWGALTRPENPIRWLYAERAFADIVAKKANNLVAQGVEMTAERLNSLRAAATREALQETEKTFYTIRRQNRGLWAARTFVAFPAATLNAFYRYGRFAIKNPARFAGFMHSYQGFFQSFGIDKYGNPVENPLDATHVLVPGTKELGLFDGQGAALNARSIGFLLNWASPSYISTVPVAWIYSKKPTAEDTLKAVLGPSYDILFPYGPPEGLGGAAKSLIPNWARDFIRYMSGSDGDAEFQASVRSVADYYRTLEDMYGKKFPGMEKVVKDAKELYKIKMQWSAASIFGIPAKVETRPMRLFEQYYDILVNKHITLGNTTLRAKELAEKEMLAVLGPTFPIDRVSYSGSTAKAYIPPTSEAWNRVFVDNSDLVKQLVNINPETIGLMTADLDENREDFNLSVYRLLKNPKTKLPGGVLLNDVALTPEEIERRRQINRTQDKYNKRKDLLTRQAIDEYGKETVSQVPVLQAQLDDYAFSVLKNENRDWWDQKNSPEISDISYDYARALKLLTSNDAWMAKYGQTRFYQDAKEFIIGREIAATAYKSVPDNFPNKPRIKEAYNELMQIKMKTWSPKLQEIINRYFENDSLKMVR